MNPWIARAVILAAICVMAAIRVPHIHRSRGVKVVKDQKGLLEAIAPALAMLGFFFVPLVWIGSPLFSFADYPLRRVPLVAGAACLVAGLWILHRSHADLGTNFSMTLQLRENHRLIAHGVYRYIRHPMYSAFLLYSVGQMLVLPNWVAGPSSLVAFGIVFALRVHGEEKMMVQEFGKDYSAYMAKTKRLIPGLW
jgi:protein-S-isoprenylcysteine O-methyltransferase Ste14